MSQTPHNSADSNNNRDSINDYVSDFDPLSNDHLLSDPQFPPQEAKHQRNLRPWWQRLGFNSKTVALIITVSILSGLGFGATSFFANRSTTQPSPQTDQVQDNDLEDNSLPLTLIIETVVAVLLLIGLIAAYLANRARRPSLPDTDDDKLAQEEFDGFLQLPTQSGLNLDQARVPPQPSITAKAEKPALEEQNAFKQLSAQESAGGGSGSRFEQAQSELILDPDKFIVQEEETELAQRLTKISLRLRQSIDLEDLFKSTVKEVRRAIKSDRVIIFKFDPSDWEGTVLAESVASGFPQILRVKIDDPCFRDKYVEKYQNGLVTKIDDIYQTPRVTECYRKMLEQFAVKANLVAPILKNNQLFGLLIAHQCSEPRNWQKSEIEFFTQLADQVGLAIDQVDFLEQQEEEAERVHLLMEISFRLCQSLNIEDLLKTAVKEVRRALKTDRVLIYVLGTNGWEEGLVVAESVAPGLPQTLRIKISEDPSLEENRREMYNNGQVYALNNIYQEPGLTERHIKSLEQFAIKASIVAPILKNNQLLGLLITHQCSEPRTWSKSEMNFLAQTAIQVGFAIDQVNLVDQYLERKEP